jgi:DNA-directed RNA polymerase specialized sigma24 family protein
MKADGNVQMAEDATATTFMKAFENINKFSAEKEGSSFAARIYNIAYHSLLDILKRKESNRIDDENNISDDSNYIDYFQKHVQTEQILTYLEEL